MLKKYEQFVKLSKTKQCSIYEANLRNDMQKVIIKKLKTNINWNQILKLSSLKLQSHSNFIPNILEIFKQNYYYFFVYEKPSGSSFISQDINIKFQIHDFYQLYNELLIHITQLKQQIPNLYILPQWMFLQRNSIKICHFEPYFQQKSNKKDKQNHVFIYNMLKGNQIEKQLQQSQSKSKKRIKNLNFNLGYIAYHLLTGTKIQHKQNQSDYQNIIQSIISNTENVLLNFIKNKKLINFILKLLNCTDEQNTFEQINLQNNLFSQFTKFINHKKQECCVCKLNRKKFKIVEFSMEKIKLQSKINKIKAEKLKKCIRPCCQKRFLVQVDPEPGSITPHRYQIVYKTQNNQKLAQSRQIKFKIDHSPSLNRKSIQQKSRSFKTMNKHKITASCQLPQLETVRRQKTVLAKTKILYPDKEIKKSLQANRTAKIYALWHPQRGSPVCFANANS